MIAVALPRLRSSSKQEKLVAEVFARLLADPRARVVLLVVLLGVGLALCGYWIWERAHRGPQTVAVSVPGTNPAGRVRIATWNLRKFSERDKAGEHPPDLVTIANIIRENGFDLLAIQEVQQQGQMAQKLRRQLNEPWRVQITDPTGTREHERYAFLYRSDRVELLDGPKLIGGSEAGNFERVPAMATFRSGNFDFILVTAHLWYGTKANNARRRNEAAALARFARDLAANGPEKDVIVLGDFNEMRSSGNLGLFENEGWVRLNQEPTNLGSSEVFDNILIDPTHTREFAGSVGVVKFDQALFANDHKRAADEVSDHRPVWADFSTVMGDDD